MIQLLNSANNFLIFYRQKIKYSKLSKILQKNNFWFLIVWIAFAVPLISLLFFQKNLENLFEIELWKQNLDQIQIYNTQIQTWFAITGLQNITWEIYVWPFKTFDFYKEILLSAQNNLSIEIYDITLDDIKKIFKQLAERWVNLKIITEKSKYKEYGSSFEKLSQSLNFSWLQLQNDSWMNINYMHAKFFVFDDKFIIQTANLTYSAFTKNRETFFVSTNPEIRNSLQKIFDKDWHHQKVQEQDIATNLLVCNIDCRDKLEKLLNSAQKNIYIWHQNLSDDSVINILKSKKDLDIKIILSNVKENAEAKTLFAQNIKLISSPYIHNKAIIIDDKYLIIWSFNLTENSLDHNREISIILIEPEIISKYLENFLFDWNK